MPDGGIRDYLHGAFFAAVPAGYRDGPPDGGRIFGNNRKIRQALTFEAGPSHLPGAAWWSRLIERSVQPKAGDESDGVRQPTTAVKELEGCVGAIGDSHDLTFGVPAPHQEEQLSCPFGERLVPLALLFGVTLGVGHRAERNGKDQTREAHGISAKR